MMLFATMLLLLRAVSPSLSQLTIVPAISPLIVIPSFNVLLAPETFLACAVTPPLNLITRWILPSGIVTVFGVYNNLPRFIVSQGNNVNGTALITILVIQNTTYEDAGTYTCEARNTSDTTTPTVWYSAAVELQLLVHLQTDDPNVTASTNYASVDLRCTMTDYVRPIQWFKGDTLLESNPRYSFSVEFGEPDRVQSGQSRLGPSEIRVLTIADPQLSDSGTYTCRAQDTDESARVQLTISEDTPPVPDVANSGPMQTLQIVLGTVLPITAVLVLTMMMVIIITIFIANHQRKAKKTSPDNAEYDYVCPLPTLPPRLIPNAAYQAPIEAIATVKVARDDTVDGITAKHEQASDIRMDQNTAYEAVRVMESVTDVHHLNLEMEKNSAYGL